MKVKLGFIDALGRMTLRFFKSAGELGIFTGQAIYHSCTPPFYPKEIGRMMVEIGFYSLPVVALTTLFSGMVIALQTYAGFSQFSAEGSVSLVVLVAVTRELAPVMAALMVAGRIGGRNWDNAGYRTN